MREIFQDYQKGKMMIATAKFGCRGVLRGASRRMRQFSQYGGQYGRFRPPSGGGWLRKAVYGSLGIGTLGLYAYYMWWPHHTFPSSVAKILRKALWTESDRGDKDFQLALKYYLEALEHCNEIGMDTLSDEYTGIQLKAAEMFERLQQYEDAAFIYNEIATLYLKVLTAPANSPEGRRLRSRQHRARIIQRDLRIAIKLVELNRGNVQLSKAILVTHLLIAQEEVKRKLGPRQSLLHVMPEGKSSEAKTNASQDSLQINNNEVESAVVKNPGAWEPFSDEFFNAMDLLTAICISTGDLSMASKVKISMTEWMIVADQDPHKVLLSQCNLASLLYLQAEEYESREIALRREFFERAGYNYDEIKKIPEEQLQTPELEEKMKASVKENEQSSYQQCIRNKQLCIQMSVKSYESVLEFAKQIQKEAASDNVVVKETTALATYGLGVVNLHLGEYDKAERLLREARVRSKSCGYDDLILEIERELSKLFQERKRTKEPLLNGPINMDIHLKK